MLSKLYRLHKKPLYISISSKLRRYIKVAGERSQCNAKIHNSITITHTMLERLRVVTEQKNCRSTQTAEEEAQQICRVDDWKFFPARQDVRRNADEKNSEMKRINLDWKFFSARFSSRMVDFKNLVFHSIT